MALAEILGYMGATLTTICTIPQLVKAWRTKHTKDLSLPYFLLLATGVIFWLSYGILIMNGPVIYANVFTLVFVIGIIVAKLRFG